MYGSVHGIKTGCCVCFRFGLLELGLSDTLAHGRSGSGLENSVEAGVDKVGTGPFLVSENVAADLALLTLDEFDVSLHAFLGESGGEEVRDVSGRVETAEGDELPDETELSKVPNVRCICSVDNLAASQLKEGDKL